VAPEEFVQWAPHYDVGDREGRSLAKHQAWLAAVERVKTRNWHVRLFTSLSMISAIKDLVATSPVPVVFDHFGGAQAELGVEQPGFADLLELVKSGKAYAKISGAYRASRLAPDYSDAAPLARALIAANADRSSGAPTGRIRIRSRRPSERTAT
jgi:predicted TIM-barrel fold metal-dependent hydrolase